MRKLLMLLVLLASLADRTNSGGGGQSGLEAGARYAPVRNHQSPAGNRNSSSLG